MLKPNVLLVGEPKQIASGGHVLKECCQKVALAGALNEANDHLEKGAADFEMVITTLAPPTHSSHPKANGNQKDLHGIAVATTALSYGVPVIAIINTDGLEHLHAEIIAETIAELCQQAEGKTRLVFLSGAEHLDDRGHVDWKKVFDHLMGKG